jgi:hypothetical protein
VTFSFQDGPGDAAASEQWHTLLVLRIPLATYHCNLPDPSTYATTLITPRITMKWPGNVQM